MAKARIWDAGLGKWVVLDSSNAQTLDGHGVEYFATKQSVDDLAAVVAGNKADQDTVNSGVAGDILALQTSYDAHKVLTDIADGSSGLYDANTLLASLKVTLDGLTSGSSGSISDQITTVKDDLQGKIDAVKNAPIRDRVKVLGHVEADGTTVAITSDISALEAKIQEFAPYTPYNVYDLNNKPLLDATGANITYDFVLKTLSAVPTKVVTLDDAAHTVQRVPVGVAIDFKVFPIGQFTFAELEANEDFLLDNEELNTAVYADAIDDIVVGLSQDSSLIDAIKALVGDEVVQNQIKVVTDVLAGRITALENEMDIVQGADTVDGSIKKAVKDESTRAQGVESVLASGLSAEVARATGAEGDLGTRLNTLEGDASVAGSVAKSVKDAKDALQANIDAEALVRANADSALQTALDSKVVVGTVVPDHAVTALWIDTSNSSVDPI